LDNLHFSIRPKASSRTDRNSSETLVAQWLGRSDGSKPPFGLKIALPRVLEALPLVPFGVRRTVRVDGPGDDAVWLQQVRKLPCVSGFPAFPYSAHRRSGSAFVLGSSLVFVLVTLLVTIKLGSKDVRRLSGRNQQLQGLGGCLSHKRTKRAGGPRLWFCTWRASGGHCSVRVA
jgi:hypothetical protein